jgi:hypothetical protein
MRGPLIRFPNGAKTHSPRGVSPHEEEGRVKRTTLYLILWIVLLPLTVLFLLGLILVATSPVGFSDPTTVLAVSAFCSALFGAPMIVFLLLWIHASKRDRILKELGHLLGTFREIPIGDVARRVGKSEAETVELIGIAVAEGYVRGWVDHGTWTFQNAAARRGLAAPPATPPVATVPNEPKEATPAHAVRFCRKCGNKVYPLREAGTWQCPGCGNVQTTEG